MLIVVVVLLFGGAAIPKLARNLGSAKNEFEKGLDDGKKTVHAATHVTPLRPPAPGGPGVPDRRSRHTGGLNLASSVPVRRWARDGGECAT